LFTNAKNSVLEHSVQRRLQVKRVTRAQHAIYTKATDRTQLFRGFAFILASTIVAM